MATTPIKINRRSANITEGKSRAPNRSMYYAMGYQEGDFVKPMVGVANGHSTITPCNAACKNWPMRQWLALKRLVATRKFLAHPPSLMA